MLYAIRRTFFSEKFVASRRLVISSSRGWRQVPGLSIAAAGVVCLTGVAALTRFDMMLRNREPGR